MADIELRSFQSILGAMAARLMAETDLNDVTPGSAFLTILEAAAASDFQLEAKLIQLRQIRNIDKATGVDLENLAFEMGLNPTRLSATPSKAFLTVTETAFSKIASNIYAGSNAPVSGDDVVKVVDGSGFPTSGTIYLGRNTKTSEAANYVSITDSGSYWTIQLASPLTKDHLVGEEVVLAQGGQRTVNSGTTVFVEGVGLAPSVEFTIQQDIVLEDGEDTATNILAVANLPGVTGNVGRKKIRSFRSPPWSTAAVENDQSATGGSDPETDSDLRQRIRDHVHNLTAGTERAIIRAVIGALDDEENKRVVSAFLRKPVASTDPTILFIDDGTGFQPSFSGVGEELIVPNAAGSESILQLQKWPLVKAQVATVATEPFALSGGESLYVEIDGQAEEKVLPGTSYRTPGVVSAQEISEVINANFRTIEARAKDGQLFITPVAYDPDYVRVGVPTSGSDSNAVLRFPTTRQYTIRLYKNDRLLEKKGAEAIVQSLRSDAWTGLTSSETLQFNIDGIDSPVITFTDLDFATYTSSTSIASATVSDWVTMINKRFIGLTAASRDDGTFTVKSNRGRTTDAKISVIGGTLQAKLFPANSTSQGTSPEFSLNRLTGAITLAEPLSSGDVLKAGTVNTRGFVETSSQATFDLSAPYAAGEVVFIADAPFTAVPVAQTGTLTLSAPNSGEQRIQGAVGQFSNVQENDSVHIWNIAGMNGLFRVTSVTNNGQAVRLASPSPISGSVALNGVSNKITFFRTEGLPQLVTLPVNNTASLAVIAQAVLNQTIGLSADVQDDNTVRIATTRFAGDGALAIPSMTGNAINLGFTVGNYESNDPHIASIESSDLTGIASHRYTISAADNTAPFDTFNANLAPFDDESHNKPILMYLGANSKMLRQPLEKVDSDTLTLRTASPNQPTGLGDDLSAAAMSGVEFGQADNMVFLLDNDPTTKTFEVPMYVDATVSGPSSPSTLQFDLQDATGANLGSSSRWAGHRFADYRLWFKAKGSLPASASNTGIKLTAAQFGPNGQLITAAISYPSQDSTDAAAEFDVNPTTDTISVRAYLASDAPRSIGLLPGKTLFVDVTGSTTKYTFLPPTDLSQVIPGDIVNLTDSQFQANNRGPTRVNAVSNLSDPGNAYQFPTEAVTVDVNGSTLITLSAAPAYPVQIGDKLQIGATERAVTAISTTTQFTVASPGFTSGTGQSATLKHKMLVASNVPVFTVAVGDIIVVGSQVLRVTSVISQTEFNVDNPFAFTGLVSGVASRITLTANRYNAGTSESFAVQSAASVLVYPLKAASNAAQSIVNLINNTAGVKDLIVASNAAPSDGSGTISKSTEDVLANGDTFVQLQNGQSFIYDTANSSPSVRLKIPADVVPEIGDQVRLVPMTPQNVADHMSKKQITGLTVAADVKLVDKGRRLQISSLVAGGTGQIFAVGGRASGQNKPQVRGNVQEISSDRAQIELDRSAIELVIPGSTIKLSQPGRAKKKFPATQPASSTTIEIQVPAVGTGRLISGVPLVKTYSYSQSGLPIWAVRNVGRNRIRFEVFSGTASVPAGLLVDDWVLVGDGSSYAGTTTDTAFAPANQGWFQVRETDNSTYFDVDGQGVEQFVSTTGTSFIFASYHSVRPGDQLVLGADAPVTTANKGTYKILSVTAVDTITYSNPNAETQSPVVLGSAGVSSVSILDQSYTSYRKVVMVAPKPSDPTNRAVMIVSPGYDLGLLNEGLGAVVSLPNRLGFGTDPVPGVNGYNYWTGLLRKVSRIVSGYQPDSATYPGTAAAGIDIEPRPPQVNRVSVALKIKTSRGVSLQSLNDTIKSAIESYINSLGLGEDVVLSEIIKLVQEIPGVDSCVLVTPTPGTERITIGDNALAKISTNDIVLS